MISTFTVLGGGSAYTPGLLSALLHHRARLDLREVRLYDTDATKLSIVARLGQAMARAAGAPFAVRAVHTLDEAVAGADAVLNSTRPGGLEARLVDETIPVELGMPGQETVGPGGFFFALRSVPQALEVAEAMAREAPRAWLLNYTNPTNIVTQALTERTAVRVLGMCDQSDGDLEVLGQAIGLTGRARFLSTGTNHATWYSDLSFGGEVPRLPISMAECRPLAHHDEEHAVRFACSLELSREVPGQWPNSYLPYYSHASTFVELSRRSRPRAAIILEKLPSYYRHFEEEADKPVPELRWHRGTAGFGDMAVEVLAALSRPAGQRLVLNVPTRGAQPGFDGDTVVETVVEVGRDGLTSLPGPPPPPAFAALHHRIEAYQRSAAQAALGDRRAQVEALALNPLVGSSARAEALMTASEAARA